MSPENIVGDPVDHRADLYAFGIILYEMLTGEHPFEAPSPSAVMVRHLRDDPEPLPEEFQNTAMGEAVARCLEKQPWDRIGTARELIEILESALDDLPTMTRKRPSSGPRQPPRVEVPEPSTDETVVRDAPSPAQTVPRGKLAVVVGLMVILAVSVGWKLWLVVGATEDESATTVVISPGDDPKPGPPAPEPAVADRAEQPKDAVESIDAGEAAQAQPDAGVRHAMMEFDTNPEDDDPQPGAASPGKDSQPDSPEKPSGSDEPDPQPQRHEPHRKNRPDRRHQPARADDAPQGRVDVKISSVPTNANVTIGGTPVGSTPLKYSAVIGQPIEARISHIGYKEKVVTMTPSEDSRTIKAHLKKDHLRLVD
jgi:serine/threonine protein kinase